MFGKTDQKLLKAFARKLDSRGIKYTVVGDKNNSMLINYRADNFDDLDFQFAFNEDSTFTMYVFSIAKIEKDRLPAVHAFCNKMNDDYRWLRFYTDDDDDLTAQYDGIVNMETVGEVCYAILGKGVSIVDAMLGEFKSL